MLLFRIEDELHLYDSVTAQTSRVYDGSFGTPLQFHMRMISDPDDVDSMRNHIYCLILVTESLILTKTGIIDILIGSFWLSYDIDHREVISFYVNDRTINFLFSDHSSMIIDQRNDKPTNITSSIKISRGIFVGKQIFDENDEEYVRSIIEGPLVSLYGKNRGNYNVKSEDNKFILQFNNMSHSYANKNDLELISITSIDREEELVGGNGYVYQLYDDGLLVDGEERETNVVKYEYNHMLVLKDDGTLISLYHDTRTFPHVENVINFYLFTTDSILYIIRDDMLKCRKITTHVGVSREWKTILEKGASDIKFPTETQYDSQTKSNVKSAMSFRY